MLRQKYRIIRGNLLIQSYDKLAVCQRHCLTYGLFIDDMQNELHIKSGLGALTILVLTDNEVITTDTEGMLQRAAMY
jgi:hypothetical protein